MKGPRKRAVKSTFSDIIEWYSNQGTQQPIIVVLTDFETFAPRVLEDFIYLARFVRYICLFEYFHQYYDLFSEHRKELPISLVFGVATMESAVHDALSHRILSRLTTATFCTQNSKDFLNHLINNVIFKILFVKHYGNNYFSR